MLSLWVRLVHDERGANLVEYGLLALLIAVLAIAAVRFFGQSNNDLFVKVASNLP